MVAELETTLVSQMPSKCACGCGTVFNECGVRAGVEAVAGRCASSSLCASAGAGPEGLHAASDSVGGEGYRKNPGVLAF